MNAKIAMGFGFKKAHLGLASAYFAAGDFSRNVVDGVKNPSVRLAVTQDNIAGVKLPNFQLPKQ